MSSLCGGLHDRYLLDSVTSRISTSVAVSGQGDGQEDKPCFSAAETRSSDATDLASHGARLYNAYLSDGVGASLGVSGHCSSAFMRALSKTLLQFLCLSFLFL